MNKMSRMLSIGLITLVAAMGVVGLLHLLSQASVVRADASGHTQPGPPKALQPQANLPQVVATIQFSPGIGLGPKAVGVNPSTGYVYVVSEFMNEVAVVSGTHIITNLPGSMEPR